MSADAKAPRLSRRWRKLERQPELWLDWPDPDDRAVEMPGDPILVYDGCNGYSLWFESDKRPPPGEWWIALPSAEKLTRRDPMPWERDKAA